MNDLQGENGVGEVLTPLADETTAHLETQGVRQSEVITIGEIAIAMNKHGKVINISFPPEIFDNPPKPTEVDRLKLLEYASNAGVLSEIEPTCVRRTVRYLGTKESMRIIAQEENVFHNAVAQSINSCIQLLWKLSFLAWLRERKSAEEFVTIFPVGRSRRGKKRLGQA